MPIEIFELVVRANVDESQQQSQNRERDTQSLECSDPGRQRNQAMADQTREILKRKKER